MPVSAATDMATRAREPSTIADLAHTWDRWCQWCSVNDQRVVPTNEPTVRRFLHSQANYWGVHMMRQAASAIGEAHDTLGFEDPTEAGVRAYLSAAARGLGGPRELIPMAPVLLGDALEICAVDTTAPQSQRAAATQTIALTFGHHHRLTFDDLDHAQVTRGTADVEVELDDGRTLHLDADDHNDAFAAAQVLDEAGRRCLTSAKSLRLGLASAAARAGMATTWSPHIGAGLSDDELSWLILWTNPDYLQQLRDTTLLIVGIALARRGIELGDFDTGDFKPAPDTSWNVTIRFSKSDRDGEGTDHHLPHTCQPVPDPWCPACAVAVWLYVLERRHGRPWTGQLFPARVNGAEPPRGRMTTPLVRLIVTRLWLRAGGDPDTRIGSRSIRIGAATTAHQAGLTIAEIADTLTKHHCLDACARYVRHDGHQFHLPV